MADTESQSGDLNQVEQSRLCEEYLARIANSHRVEGHKLLCELVEKLYEPWASRRLEAIRSLDDIEEFRRDHSTYGSMTILPLFSQSWLYRTESELIDSAIADCEQKWLPLAVDQALQSMPQAADINEIERELLDYFENEPRATVERRLRDSEEVAENSFRRRRDTENWQRKDLRARPCPDQIPAGVPPPPEDWAALEYAETRLKTMTKSAVQAIGMHLRPESFVAFVKSAIQSLCRLCIAKLGPWEDTSIDSDDPLRTRCRNASWFFLSHELSGAVPRLEAEARRIYLQRSSQASETGYAEDVPTSTEACDRDPDICSPHNGLIWDQLEVHVITEVSDIAAFYEDPHTDAFLRAAYAYEFDTPVWPTLIV